MTDGLFRKGEIREFFYDALGGANSPMREPITMTLGDPTTGLVRVPESLRKYEGEVYIHDLVGDFSLPDDETTERDDFPAGRTTAFMPSGALPSGKRKYGTTVKVVWREGRYNVVSETVEGANYTKGVPENEHNPVTAKDIDYGLVRPTDPPSGRVVISGSIHPGTSEWEQLVIKITDDLIATYAGALTLGQARGIKLETDPADNSITYTAGSAYSSSARDAQTGAVDHSADFANYPRTLEDALKFHSWVRLYYQQTAIIGEDILFAPDYGRGGAGSGATSLDGLTDAAISSPLEGHGLYYNPGTAVFENRYHWDGFKLQGPNAVTSVTAGNNLQLDFTVNYESAGFYNAGTNTLTLVNGVYSLKALLRFQFASALTSAGRVYFGIGGTFAGESNTAHGQTMFLPDGTPDTLEIEIQAAAGGFIGTAEVFSVFVINATDQTMNFVYNSLVGDRHRP